ncbi:hypothetical protein CQA53_04330 [Helicobacter didelphidarum]|uniref:Calcineurin-like phosphoesterase domain-containing protein n=1 Tax=Helicobacter didelphidarum TaxID=2040648 RepID=A0A3D8INQ2_9HELI|nr:metallophosphoesterase [Helicobacter didelphidarum]RDU66244.1 hypothetical protein CQA53_04330 [Helicobacter didelphidarum]
MKVFYILFFLLLFILVGLYAPLSQTFYDLRHINNHVIEKQDSLNTIQNNKYPQENHIQHHNRESLYIALLSDLHSGTFYLNTILKNLQDAYNAGKLDLILMSGDMIDDKEDIEGAREFFKRLNLTPFDKIPKFYVTGNHELWSGSVVTYKNLAREHNTFVLDGAIPSLLIEIKKRILLLAGIDDPYSIKYDENGIFINTQYPKDWQDKWSKILLQQFSTLQNLAESSIKIYQDSNLYLSFTWLQDILYKDSYDTYNIASDDLIYQKFLQQSYKILLSHRPESIEIYKQLPFNLIVSGHTHGGQVRIPFVINGLYAPNQGILPKYAGGAYSLVSTHQSLQQYEKKDSMMYLPNWQNSFNVEFGKFLVVSRGLSFNWKLPRIYNPPEIVWIEI